MRLQRQAEHTLELLDQDQANLQDEMTSAQGSFSESLTTMAQVQFASSGWHTQMRLAVQAQSCTTAGASLCGVPP